jgi:ABC-type tungstate transport system substrate-binding protein
MALLNLQKMMLFLLQKDTKDFHLILDGLFVASIESAASRRKMFIGYLSYIKQCKHIRNKHVIFELISTSISYFTVLYSTRQNDRM